MEQKLTTHQMAVALIGAVLAFRQKWDADLAEQEKDIALMEPEQKERAMAEALPYELSDEDWWEHFTEFASREGLTAFLRPRNNDVLAFASLEKDEPSFTLLGRDILASVLVKHWSELASLSPEVRASKLDKADRIAAAMEEYHPQKWPD